VGLPFARFPSHFWRFCLRPFVYVPLPVHVPLIRPFARPSFVCAARFPLPVSVSAYLCLFEETILKIFSFIVVLLKFYTIFVDVMIHTQNISALVNGMLTAHKGQQTKVLNIVKIKELNQSIEKAEKSRFTISLQLAHEIKLTEENFTTFFESVKNKAKDLKIEKPTKAEICELVYGFQIKWYYKLLSIGKVEQSKKALYLSNCDKAESEGDKPVYSMEALQSWVNDFDSHKGTLIPTKENLKASKPVKQGKTIVAKFTLGKNSFTYYSDGTSENNGYTALELRAVVSELQAHINSTFKIEAATKQAKVVAKRNATKLQAKKPVQKPEIVTA
jgi:hypothetical protein